MLTATTLLYRDQKILFPLVNSGKEFKKFSTAVEMQCKHVLLLSVSCFSVKVIDGK